MAVRVLTPEIRTQTFEPDGAERGWVRLPEWRGDVEDFVRKVGTGLPGNRVLCRVLNRHDARIGVRRLPIFARGDLSVLMEEAVGPNAQRVWPSDKTTLVLFSWRTSQWAEAKRGDFQRITAQEEFDLACAAIRRAGTMARDAHASANAEAQREYERRAASIIEWRGWDSKQRKQLIDAHWSVDHEARQTP